jgi:hypothetical protein
VTTKARWSLEMSLSIAAGSATPESWIQAPITHQVFWRTASGVLQANATQNWMSSQSSGWPMARVRSADTGRVRAILDSQLVRMDEIFRKLK